MYTYLYIILAYFLVLLGFNIYRSMQVKSQEDFMLAGRALSIHVMVFTLIATWIGSGTFIAGAEYAYRAGFSSLWLPAGAWIGIVVIFFLAAKIRTFGQYTIGDILEARYGRFARLFGSIALIIAFTTIVSYQFRAGGYILNIVTDDHVSVAWGQAISAVFIIAFTALAGMLSVAYSDLPNGILILAACAISVPFVVHNAGGWVTAKAVLPAGHFQLFSPDMGASPVLKALGFMLATMSLLMGEQSMYQKFYAAKTPKDARKAVSLWIVGTVIVEIVVVVIAIFAAVRFWDQGYDPGSMVLLAARYMVPPVVGVLLLAAAWAVLLSTGTNFLLSPSTNVIRDIIQNLSSVNPDEKKQIVLQKVIIVVLGLIAFSMIFIPTILNKQISVLKYAYFAYTMYGVSITPALIAALAWKRATKAGGLSSIITGAIAALLFELVIPAIWPSLIQEGDFMGVPSIFPAMGLSVSALVIVSLCTPKPDEETIRKLFQKNA